MKKVHIQIQVFHNPSGTTSIHAVDINNDNEVVKAYTANLRRWQIRKAIERVKQQVFQDYAILSKRSEGAEDKQYVVEFQKEIGGDASKIGL